MIFDITDNKKNYTGLANLTKAFEFAEKAKKEKLPVGRYEIDNDGSYAMVQEYAAAPHESFEAHKKFIDVQFIMGGSEKMYYCPLNICTETVEYNDEKDCALYKSNSYSVLNAEAGSFAVFFPEDAHLPGLVSDKAETVKKIVVKIKI